MSMRAVRLTASWLFVVSLIACGGGGGGSSPPPPPKVAARISNLTYSPTGAYSNSPGGQVTISGSFSFSGANGGVASVTISVLDSAGTTVSTTTTPVPNGAGVTSGFLQGSVAAGTTVVGTFSIKVTLTDQSGLVSNALTGSFRISAFPWVSMTAMPTPRIYAAVVAIGSRFYVMGGEPTSSPMIPAPALTTVEVFDASTGTWSTGAPLPVPLEYLSAINVNGKIYVFGGGAGGLSVCYTSLSAYVFDPQSNAWTTLAAPPMPIGGAAVASIGTRIFVMGGVASCPGGGTASAAVNAYDIATNSWSTAASMLGAAVQLGAGAQNGKIEEFGGFAELNGGNGNASPSAAVYDPATNVWTVNPNGFVMDGVFVISDTATALAGGSLYSIGGRTSIGTLESGTREFDPTTSSWLGKESLPANASVFGPVADAYNGVVYVFSPTTTWVYTPANDLH
jgi:hypothetical protein